MLLAVGIALGATVLLYAGLVLALAIAGRGADARATARFVPDCAVLFARLVRDPRLPRRRKTWLVLTLAYLASPIDLIPDFIPVAGQLDDALVVTLALRHVLRGAPAGLLEELWPGPPASLRALSRLAA